MVTSNRGANSDEVSLASAGVDKTRLGDLEDEEAITLDNFDETDAMANPILTSPRSIEACRMLGVEPEELIQRPLEYFIRQAIGTGEDREFIAKRAARYEKNRQMQLRNVRVQRHELIEAQLDGIHGSMSLRTRSYCRSPVGAARLGFGATNSSSSYSTQEYTVIEREKRALERIQRRQALEMQQMFNYEMKMTELHQEREKKEHEHRRQQELLAKERLRRQRLADEQRRRKEFENAEQHRLEIEQTRRESQEHQMEMIRREQRSKQEEARRQREARLNEKERRRHQEETRVQNELYQFEREREAARKLQEITIREERMTEERNRQRQVKAQELAEKQARNTARIANVMHEKDLQRKAQLEDAARKQQQSEERRRAFEEERKAKEEEVRLQALHKKETIEGVQAQLALIEEQRRERLRDQDRQAQLRLMQREREKQQQLDAQQREERHLERERRSAYERMEAQLHKKQSEILRKREEKDMVAQMVQSQKNAAIRSRLQEAKLREEEIQSALVRKNKQDEYRANLLLSRIEGDNQRTRQIKEQRMNLIRRREQIKQTATRQKQEILESFYKMRVTKRFELPKHLATSIVVERPRSASATMLRTRSLSTANGTMPSMSGGTLRSGKITKRPSSAIARRPRSASSMSHRLVTSHNHRALADNSCDDDGDQESEVEGNESVSKDETDDERYTAAINELRRQQNEELLEILEEEHHAEEQREHLLRQASTVRRERVRMEQLFDKERALASERIMQLTDRHERALASKMDEFRMK